MSVNAPVSHRWISVIRGLLWVLVGVIILALPVSTAGLLVLMLGIAMLLDGVVDVTAAAGMGRGGGARRWAGLVGMLTGVLAFRIRAITEAEVLFYLASWGIIVGTLELFAAGRLRKETKGALHLALTGAVLLVFGLLLLLRFSVGARPTTSLIGAYAVAFGICLILLPLCAGAYVKRTSHLVLVAFAVVSGSYAVRSDGQELEPRTYSPNPVGLNFLVVAAGEARGDVLFDPAAPIQDVKAQLRSGILGYGRTFGVLNRSASVALAMPYVTGTVSGAVGEDRAEVHRSGLGDARLRIGVNLFGGDALSPERFARRVPKPSIGASLLVVAPTGQYDPHRLVNIGSNRWALKPELGFSYPAGRFLFEAYAGVWFFGDNNDYLGGSRRSQESLTAGQAHVSYSFRPGLWLAADATHYTGGRTRTNGVPAANRQENTRVGLTLSVPLRQKQSIKIAWSRGTTVRFGGDFDTVAIAWQYAWLD